MSIIEAWLFFLFFSLSFNAIHAIREYDQQNDHTSSILLFTYPMLHFVMSLFLFVFLAYHFTFLSFGLFPMHMHPLGFILVFGKIFISLFASFAYRIHTGDLRGWHNCFQAFSIFFLYLFIVFFDFYTSFFFIILPCKIGFYFRLSSTTITYLATH